MGRYSLLPNELGAIFRRRSVPSHMHILKTQCCKANYTSESPDLHRACFEDSKGKAGGKASGGQRSFSKGQAHTSTIIAVHLPQLVHLSPKLLLLCLLLGGRCTKVCACPFEKLLCHHTELNQLGFRKTHLPSASLSFVRNAGRPPERNFPHARC